MNENRPEVNDELEMQVLVHHDKENNFGALLSFEFFNDLSTKYAFLNWQKADKQPDYPATLFNVIVPSTSPLLDVVENEQGVKVI